MKNNLFLIVVLITVLTLGSAIAMTSADKFGTETNEFTTATPVYITHPVTVFCNSEMENKELRVYIVPDQSWNKDDEIKNAVVNTTVQTNSRGKLLTAMIWESPKAGEYDIVVDIDNNGKYSYADMCSDLLDDNMLTGFTVKQAENPEESPEETEKEETAGNDSASAEQAKEETALAANNGTTTVQAEKTAEGKADYIPFLIIAVAIVIAALIIAVTLVRMR
ncbi:MAG: hypothetical protein QW666_04205 [Candidatus Woesearchaeota archaeon]